MTRARKALLRAERGYREAIALRDPVLFRRSLGELVTARNRLTRQEANSK